MRTYTVKMPGKPDLRFRGDRIGKGKYGGEAILLYRTDGGNLLCIIEDDWRLSYSHSYYGNNLINYIVAYDYRELKSKLGHGNAAKRLYKNIGIEDIVEID